MSAAAGHDIVELNARLREAEETLDAIRNGDVDAVVVRGPAGQKVYTLQNADRPYRVLIEQMQEGAVTLGEGGTVLYCNQRLATLLGSERQLLIGATLAAHFAPAEFATFEQLLRECGGAGCAAEFTLRTRGGLEVPVNLSLAELTMEDSLPRVLCAVVTNLTQNRQRRSELAESNSRLAREIDERRRAEDSLQLALAAADMGSWDLDLETDIVRRSPRHDQIFGHAVSLQSWRLGTALRHFVGDDRESVALAFERARETGTIDIERRIRRAGDGAIRWLHLKGCTYYDCGLPMRIAGVVADVTERREVEEQLRQAQKMEAVGQLTGGIAHDFNNLLMVIGGSLDVLGRSIPGQKKTLQLLEIARRGIARGARLNQQLLSFSRRQDLQVQTLCIDELLPDFVHLLDRAVGETVAVRIEHAAEAWYCDTDPHELETALLNLAINARDAMPDGGSLVLGTANVELNPQTAARWGAPAGEYIALSVSDNGSGMPPEIVARVFEPFFTTKEVGKGTGLGLSQVYGFARQSGGFVSIESERGRGTTVKIHLPRSTQRRAPAPGVEPRPATSPADGDGVVLVVEDDPDVRATTSNMLRDLGYAVSEAATGRAALAMIEGGIAVDLVFTDVIMPDGMSGLELARELRARRSGPAILLTSGYTAQGDSVQRFEGSLRLLRKPYTLPDLSTAVHEALQQQRRASCA